MDHMTHDLSVYRCIFNFQLVLQYSPLNCASQLALWQLHLIGPRTWPVPYAFLDPTACAWPHPTRQ